MRPTRRLTPLPVPLLSSLVSSILSPVPKLCSCPRAGGGRRRERARELARLLLQGHFDLRARREEAELSALNAGDRAVLAAGRTRLEKGHRRQLATVVGPVTVTRRALRAPGRTNCCPADAVLNLPRVRHSLGLRKLAVLEACRGSCDTALEAIDRRCGARLMGKWQAEELVRAAAVDIAAFYLLRTPEPAAKQTLLVLSFDGKGIVMGPGHLREATQKAAERAKRTFRTRLSAGEKSGRKRMATLAVVHDAEPAVRRPHDIIAPPGGRTGQRTVRKGPKARAKWLTASVEHDPEHVIKTAFDQAEARDPQHRRNRVVLVDGATHQLDLVRAEAGRRGVTVHVIEKLWAAARCFHTATDPDAETWVGTKAARILAGDASGAVADIRAEAARRRLTDDQRAAADTACRYLTNNADHVHYDQALTAGWPIASGIVEGAARHLIADRLDITGSRWSLAGAEAVLTLRAVISNNDFPEYWIFHTARERERLYPQPDQHAYGLSA
ncbi:ISKra4 family transposase [Streptomyces sp. ActVer]|uniref:ISKra4 family transposase n=1 Tax=Streptomyces sp. ActVer TaxID=3014558 RepID=UPI0022B51D18|nr:ISKra4 family transposase [Streptomyces sp. ActVer]MCZ4510041.1 ISKra4 family transposase [Streptomyces sp. ActVer]